MPIAPPVAEPPKDPEPIACSGCGTRLRVTAAHSGKAIRCPKCQQVMKVPALPPPKIAPMPAADAISAGPVPKSSPVPSPRPSERPVERSSERSSERRGERTRRVDRKESNNTGLWVGLGIAACFLCFTGVATLIGVMVFWAHDAPVARNNNVNVPQIDFGKDAVKDRKVLENDIPFNDPFNNPVKEGFKDPVKDPFEPPLQPQPIHFAREFPPDASDDVTVQQTPRGRTAIGGRKKWASAFEIELAAGFEYRIEMAWVKNSGDVPYLVLRAADFPNGAPVAEGPRQLPPYRATKTARHRIEATSQEGEEKGPFTLKVTRKLAVETPLKLTDDKLDLEDTLTDRDVLRADLLDKFAKVYTIELPTNKKFIVDHIFPGSDAYLIVLDPSGNVIGRDDDSGGQLNARLQLTPPAAPDGAALPPPVQRYRIVATSLGGQGTGRFTLKISTKHELATVKPPERPPQPPPAAAGLEGVEFRELTKFKISTRPLDTIVWSRNGKSLYTLSSSGVLQRLAVDDGAVLDQNDLAVKCNSLHLSSEGLVVGAWGAKEVWVVNPDKLADVRKKIHVPNLGRVAAGRDASRAVAIGDNFNRMLALIDLKAGTVVRTYDRVDLQAIAVDAKANYAYAIELGKLVRLRISEKDLAIEDKTPDINANGGRIILSGDGEYVASPYAAGNRNPAFAEPGYNTFVFSALDFKARPIVVKSAQSPHALGIDTKSGHILAQNTTKLLILFDFEGKQISDHTFAKILGGLVNDISVAPDGFQAVLRTNDRLLHATLKRAP